METAGIEPPGIDGRAHAQIPVSSRGPSSWSRTGYQLFPEAAPHHRIAPVKGQRVLEPREIATREQHDGRFETLSVLLFAHEWPVRVQLCEHVFGVVAGVAPHSPFKACSHRKAQATRGSDDAQVSQRISILVPSSGVKPAREGEDSRDMPRMNA
jgi:hypothetical protein